MNRSNLRNWVVLAITTVVILGGVWLVQAKPWSASRGDPTDPGGLSTSGVTLPKGQDPPKVGQTAPDFTAPGIDGTTISLSGLRGKPVWLILGTTWCTYCRSEAPDVQALSVEYAGRVTVVAVYIAEDELTVTPYAERLKLTYPQIADANMQIGTAYAVMGMPAHFFLDSTGTVAQTRVGAISRQAASNILASLT